MTPDANALPPVLPPALPLVLSPEVAAARSEGRSLVALESTIITHGMPRPQNIQTAHAVEQEVRHAGAVPATIAVIEGVLHIGMTAAQLDALGKTQGVRKLSRADLAVAMATAATGSTTVAATMIAARAAGIEVFATGGIGGVHRGAEASFDISADLSELARTPATVVAAGAKAILDLPKTLEALGVPVIAMGQDEFPAFWSRTSGLPAPLRLDRPADIARAHLMRRALGIGGGQLVAIPISEDDEIPAAELAPLIAQAHEEARAKGIHGKDVTPFLLSRLFDLTGGRTLAANISLVRNNAREGARIARALDLARPQVPPAQAEPL